MKIHLWFTLDLYADASKTLHLSLRKKSQDNNFTAKTRRYMAATVGLEEINEFIKTVYIPHV